MNCMKCGEIIAEEAVFCEKCLVVMEKYPVHHLARVEIPERKEHSILKKVSKHHMPTAEEQVVLLRKWILRLTVALVICLIAIAFMLKPTLHYALDQHVEIGQNYSSVNTNTGNTTPKNGD